MSVIEKRYPTIGACGLDCGLCPRYYTDGPSRCPGCAGPGFFDKHPSCAFITCCVKKRNLETCGQCPDFPCGRFKSEQAYRRMQESPSYPPATKILANLNSIKQHGVERFAGQQRKRIEWLQRVLDAFNDGRSKRCYCRAAALLDPETLDRTRQAAERKIKAESIPPDDTKAKAKILRALLDGKS